MKLLIFVLFVPSFIFPCSFTEQQHVETNLKANFAGVSVFLFFQDEDQKFMLETKGDQTNSGSHVTYLGAECQDIFLYVQVIMVCG